MAVLNLRINTGRTGSPILANEKLVTTIGLVNMIDRLKSGLFDTQTLRADVTPIAATGTFTTSGGSGTQTAIINGVSIAITWATSDTNSAALMAAAINASSNPLISGLVTATSALGVVTVTTATLGVMGNAVTTTATGTGFTAGQARLTGGSDGTTSSFTY